MIDCQQAFALLQDILDKEANQIDEKQVRAHLEKCSHCFEKFRLEESIQEFINEKIKSTSNVESKSDKLESMRLGIMSQLDEIDAECEKSKNSPFGSTLKIFLSTAAMVVLAGIWYFSSGLNGHRQYTHLEQAHWTVSEDVTPYTQNIVQAEYLGSIEKNFHYNMHPSFSDYTFVGGKKESIDGNEFEHIVYANDKDYISIFISDNESFEIPNDLKSTMIKNGNLELFDHNCHGCRLVYHKVGLLTIITASTNRDLDLTAYIPGELSI